MVCMVASVMGTFLDSFLGSVFEESWWCSMHRRVIHFEEHACEKCEEARRKGESVSGHSPSKCGLVCGRPVMNGSFVNLLSSSLTSVLVGVGLYFVYLSCSCLWHRVPCEKKQIKHDSSTTKPNDATSVVYFSLLFHSYPCGQDQGRSSSARDLTICP